MADDAHVEIIRKGVLAWNEWRGKHYDEKPDLSYCNLSGINLKLVDLSNTDLSNANLSDTDLEGARLMEASLQEADLSNSNLENAYLQRANLVRCDLKNAELSFADFYGADLTNASLHRTYARAADFRFCHLTRSNLAQSTLDLASFIGSNLSHANLSGSLLRRTNFASTIFSNTDLSNTIDIDKAIHRGPSSIDTRTLSQSWPLPLSFLRGCGLSSWEIESAKLYETELSPDKITQILYNIYDSRIGEPIQRYTCFISYSNNDYRFTRKLYEDLKINGIHCWFAPESMRGGKKIHRQINQAIRVYDKLLLILSQSSMHSAWVSHEIKQARRREIDQSKQMLFPIGLANFNAIQEWELFDAATATDLADEIRSYYIPDFSDWENTISYEKALNRLVGYLKEDFVGKIDLKKKRRIDDA